jgi:hypothetical protein
MQPCPGELNLQARKDSIVENAVYMCERCCYLEGCAYRWPPYRPPNIDAELAEPVELSDDEEGKL